MSAETDESKQPKKAAAKTWKSLSKEPNNRLMSTSHRLDVVIASKVQSNPKLFAFLMKSKQKQNHNLSMEMTNTKSVYSLFASKRTKTISPLSLRYFTELKK